MADPLVSNQGINIAGHKIPFALVMAGAAVVTIFLIMKSRSGASVAIGPQPAVTGSTTDPYGAQLAVGSPAEAQFANLSQQLFGIQQQLTPSAAPAPVITGLTETIDMANAGGKNNFPSSGVGTIPVMADPNNPDALIGWANWSQAYTITGAPVIGRSAHGTTVWEPIDFGGAKGYINAEGFQSIHAA